MMNYKKCAMLIALMSACQIQTAAHAGKIAKGAAVGASVLLLGKVATSRYQWSQLMEDPNAKKAFEMLGNSADCKFIFTVRCAYGLDGDDYEYFNTYDMTGSESYAHIRKVKDSEYGKFSTVKNLRVCSADSCVDVESIKTLDHLAAFLRRVDSVEAPILGYQAPGLRRLVNRLTRP